MRPPQRGRGAAHPSDSTPVGSLGLRGSRTFFSSAQNCARRDVDGLRVMPAIGLHPAFTESFGLRWLSKHQADIATSLERLSTGKKINRASDNPDGFVASENLKSEQRQVLAKISVNNR